MRLLVVEDEAEVSQRIEAACAADGLNCHVAETGAEALEMTQIYDYAAIILDILLPDICGFDIVSRLRAVNDNTPILMLSGMTAVEDKVKSLTMGADDYVTKPFSKSELLARVYAIIRRASGHSSSVIKIGPMEIDIKQRKVLIYGTELVLTSKEYSVLELLAMKRGSILAKETFLNHIYGGMDEPELKIVDVFICKLRKKIAQLAGDSNLIETVWGRGYLIREVKFMDNIHSSSVQQTKNGVSDKKPYNDSSLSKEDRLINDEEKLIQNVSSSKKQFAGDITSKGKANNTKYYSADGKNSYINNEENLTTEYNDHEEESITNVNSSKKQFTEDITPEDKSKVHKLKVS